MRDSGSLLLSDPGGAALRPTRRSTGAAYMQQRRRDGWISIHAEAGLRRRSSSFPRTQHRLRVLVLSHSPSPVATLGEIANQTSGRGCLTSPHPLAGEFLVEV